MSPGLPTTLPFVSHIHLIRYLVVWRVNASLVHLPRCLSLPLSHTLGSLIAERLPTQDARPWRKAMAAWGDQDKAAEELAKEPIATGKKAGKGAARKGAKAMPVEPFVKAPPNADWPIQAVLFPLPAKRTYGQGEPIVWELKLLGDDADHGLFLELILPAMEQAATTTDPRWRRPNGLWGRFDIQAVYAARGLHWEPVVSDGRLDLGYRALPAQWAEGWPFDLPGARGTGAPITAPSSAGPEETSDKTLLASSEAAGTGDGSSTAGAATDLIERKPRPPASQRPGPAAWLQRVTWITPFDLATAQRAPSMRELFEAFIARMTPFAPGKRPTADQVWALLDPAERRALEEDLEKVAAAPVKRSLLTAAPKGWPGRWIGAHAFDAITPRLASYLELAAIVHVGRQTHFGCGTFKLS
ncbi:MAG: CRISPR system precrRNA processing endoribonuclease RAMP protein Cas6 [Chloroflexi bacterium]|nr:CRISPR system precrRNA processing endoribonuclease RAMP protein Cas6 [Chloroflexota bacterium]